MHIIVLGAAGRTGSQIVQQALRAGHTVTALVRDDSTYGPPAVGVQVHRADVSDPSSLAGAFAGSDTVINAIGPRNGKEPAMVYSEGAANVTAEMRRAGVRRLVTVSAVPASLPHEKNLFERLLLHPILWRFFGPSYADLRIMEAALRDSANIDWTIIRPPLLTDDEPTGIYRTAIDSHLNGAKKISRTDLATAMLAASTNDTLIGHILTVSI
ncbi:NAD(P)-dependent oxidoreductase [Paeniglutamicibacter antarcticus]|uniref:SDR family oxidoreductase n=1 Tax=Paeniglutamicibacter antarcticus TaxID=494023 RepID=A0ABP9TLU7_9MICC